MSNSKKAKAIHAGSTQRFTEIEDIKEDVVVIHGRSACLIIEVQASNFALLSVQEQDAKIYAYASLLNSLSFSIQIVIQNKKIDLSSYIALLDTESKKTSAVHSNLSTSINQSLIAQIKLYKNFIQELVKVNTVLDKRFYIIVPYTYLEKGVGGVTNVAPGKNAKEDFFMSAKAALHTKANSILSQLARLSLRAKVLEEEELIKLFYELYNQDQITSDNVAITLNTPIIKSSQNL